MKLFIKIMLLLVVVAVAGPFFIKGHNGKPLMSVDDLHVPKTHFSDVGAAVDEAKESLATKDKHAGPIEVFRWQDANGVWHYSDSNQSGGTAQRMTVNPDASVVHLESVRHENPETPAVGKEARNSDSPSIPLLTSIPADKIPGLVEDAKRVKKLQQERQRILSEE